MLIEPVKCCRRLREMSPLSQIEPSAEGNQPTSQLRIHSAMYTESTGMTTIRVRYLKRVQVGVIRSVTTFQIVANSSQDVSRSPLLPSRTLNRPMLFRPGAVALCD